MDYALIFALQLIGISLSVGQKILELDKKFEDDSFLDVWGMFWKQDRTTVVISVIILALNLVVHFIIDEYTDFPITIENYSLYAFGIAFLLGYAGQRIIYSWLGKAEKKLIEKGDNVIGK